MSKPIAEASLARRVGYSAFATQQLERRPLKVARFEIKLFRDDEVLVAGDNAAHCILRIPRDIDGCALVECEACVTTVGGAQTAIQIRNITQAHDMLSTKLTIDSGELDSDTAAPPVILDANKIVARGNQLAFDIDGAGGGAMGLNVVVMFA